MAEKPVAALTGATGFLGRYLAEELLAAGFHVRALVRKPLADLSSVEPVAGDLAGEKGALDRLVSGAALVVHAAAVTQANEAATFHAINAGGTERLLRCTAAIAPDAHVVHVSSLAAREPQLSAYAASKRAAEAEARRLVASERLVIVRPPTLYGPRGRQTLAVFRSARLPLCPLLGTGRERIALLHVADAARSIVELAKARTSGIFTMADGRPAGYGMREIFEAAGRAQGRKVRFLRVPSPVFRGVGAASTLAGRLAGRAPLLSPDKVREMLHEDWSVAPGDMPPGLVAAARSINQGFTETVTWYRQAGWL